MNLRLLFASDLHLTKVHFFPYSCLYFFKFSAVFLQLQVNSGKFRPLYSVFCFLISQIIIWIYSPNATIYRHLRILYVNSCRYLIRRELSFGTKRSLVRIQSSRLKEFFIEELLFHFMRGHPDVSESSRLKKFLSNKSSFFFNSTPIPRNILLYSKFK